MKSFLHVCMMAALVFAMACTGSKTNDQAFEKQKIDSLRTSVTAIFPALPKEAPNPENALTPEKIALGKILYFETRLSKKGNNSCNSCHNLSTFGVDNKPFSIGDEGKPGGRNSPTSFNAALQFVQFWDGRAKDVEEQAGGPILNPVEMNMPDKAFVEKQLNQIKGYKELFAKAFPNDKKPITYENMQKAIGAFERTLLTPAPYDAWLAGNDSALSQTEVKGLQAFNETGCTTCHMGTLFGGMLYQKFPLYGDQKSLLKTQKEDLGRFDVTKAEGDKYMFKVPMLRNVTETGPYFHNGAISDLKETIKIMGTSQLNKTLTQEEIDNIAAFLKCLKGDVSDEVKKAPALPGA